MDALVTGRTAWIRCSLFSLTMALACLAVFLKSAPAYAQVGPIRYHSSSVFVADGQYARLAVYFTATDPGRPGLPPGPCRVTMRLLDQSGATVQESVTTLAPGRDAVLDHQPVGLRPGERATLRAVVIGERDSNGFAPRIYPSLDVVDSATGRTLVSIPGQVRTYDGRPLQGSFGVVGLASQQVARVSASYVGFPSDTGLPPGPCNVTLSLVSGNGSVLVSRRVTLNPGQTTWVDFSAGFLVPGVRRRLWATVETDGREQGFVSPALEGYDAPDGKSAFLHPAAFVQSWGWE